MRTITFDVLDPASIDNAISELEAYTRWFTERCEILRQRVAERIGWNARQGFLTARGNDIIVNEESFVVDNTVTVTVTHNGTVSVVLASGPEAVFIEFGAGVFYNGAPGDSPHPWGIENGYTIGSYGKHKGVRNAWNIAKGVVTRGTPADMPMYRGAEEAIRALDVIVRDVFR